MKNINIIIASFCFCCFLYISILYIQLGNETQGSRWVYDAYNLKEEAASEILEPKIVIVSGSNGLFGVDSDLLSHHLGKPVVNYAVHAGLGPAYILYKSKKVLKPGDIAILPIEYSHYQHENISSVLLDYILSRDVDYFRGLTIEEKIDAILRVSISRTLLGLKNNKSSVPIGVYGIHNINSYGDQVNISMKDMSPSDIRHRDNLKETQIKGSTVSNKTKDLLHNYIAWAKNNNITLIFTPPNYMYFEYYDGKEFVDFLRNINLFYNGENALYIGNPQDYMFDKKFYFNTTSHLNKNGVERRTLQMIKDLKNTFN